MVTISRTLSSAIIGFNEEVIVFTVEQVVNDPAPVQVRVVNGVVAVFRRYVDGTLMESTVVDSVVVVAYITHDVCADCSTDEVGGKCVICITSITFNLTFNFVK